MSSRSVTRSQETQDVTARRSHDCDEEAVCCQYRDHGEDGHGDEGLVPP